MSKTGYLRLSVIALVIGLTVFVAIPGPASAQTAVNGSATALQATVTSSPRVVHILGDSQRRLGLY